jgi:hypothetical protein
LIQDIAAFAFELLCGLVKNDHSGSCLSNDGWGRSDRTLSLQIARTPCRSGPRCIKHALGLIGDLVKHGGLELVRLDECQLAISDGSGVVVWAHAGTPYADADDPAEGNDGAANITHSRTSKGSGAWVGVRPPNEMMRDQVPNGSHANKLINLWVWASVLTRPLSR